MARTTKAERKRRMEAALAKISDGHGFADAVGPSEDAARVWSRRSIFVDLVHDLLRTIFGVLLPDQHVPAVAV